MLLSEFGQIEENDTFDPHMTDKIIQENIKKVLSLLTMIKEKSYGKIKARSYADGRKQRIYIYIKG